MQQFVLFSLHSKIKYSTLRYMQRPFYSAPVLFCILFSMNRQETTVATVRDTDNLHFLQTHHVGFPMIAKRQYTGTPAAMQRSSMDPGNVEDVRG